MTDVLVVVHPDRDDAHNAALAVIDWCAEAGLRVVMPEPDAARLGRDDLGVSEADLEPAASGTRLALSIGGDGTMLFTSGLVAAHGVPVLGINTGRLGYLTEVEPHESVWALESFSDAAHTIEPRMRVDLMVERRSGEVEGPFSGLNEGVVEKYAQGHTVHLSVEFDDVWFNTYSADGLIVATPTGSTAYSMSARGPIVEPTHEALLFTPVSPHTLFDRSLVLAPSTSVRMTVSGDRDAVLTVDGTACAHLYPGDSVVAGASPHPTKLVSFGRRSFHQLLTSKFGLGGES